jgi:hypothetical protein
LSATTGPVAIALVAEYPALQLMSASANATDKYLL